MVACAALLLGGGVSIVGQKQNPVLTSNIEAITLHEEVADGVYENMKMKSEIKEVNSIYCNVKWTITHLGTGGNVGENFEIKSNTVAVFYRSLCKGALFKYKV